MTLKRLLFLLVGLCVLALAVKWQRDDVPPEQASPSPAPVAQVPPASSPPLAPPVEAARPNAAASAVAESRPPMDASRLQREIQMAVSSQERGKAGEAARHILRCLDAEGWAAAFPHGSVDRSKFERDWVAAKERMLPACQAVDAASRAQLVPLLRRSVSEGDKGAAAKLALAMVREFKPAAEPAVMAALRRDAWDCDQQSVSRLFFLAHQHAQILTPNELGALRAQWFEQVRVEHEAALRKSLDGAQLKAAMAGMQAGLEPPPGADTTEVARMAADIQSRCKTER
ncbi:hypothetical protein [Roseateles sp. LYH14W]|uniref:Uncharacterized protein n=1 Tax=Pelomonas parva TaxID=3299032 RepID=A0ABW7F6K9_9BURK